MKKLIQQICSTLGDGQDLVLVTISSQSGSTPRLAGAKMIILRDGRIGGTIGGGQVEALAMEEAAQCFSNKKSLRKAFDLTNSMAANTDMICGGRMEVFLEYIAPSESNREVFRRLLESMHSGRRITLVCPLAKGSDEEPRFVVDHRGTPSHTEISDDLLSSIKQVRSSTSAATLIEHEGREYLLSYFAVAGTVYLLGAGHVSACTAEAATRVGFRVVVLDDRSEFANTERFPLAEEVKVLSDFDNCFEDFEIDHDAYLVIVTRGHMHDMDVLEQALRTEAGYIGMIGSRKKRNAIYKKLMDKGFKEELLESVHCPIGLGIEADTPEEIAISIVGELIYQRATGRKAWHLI
ncbi:MAG: XdhC family protein [Desulfobulbus sp.]|nr:XdhC family protein [Desulfobulbus sp.]